VVVLAVFLAYGNALRAQFVADDFTYLRLASQARSPADVIRYFTQSVALSPVLAPVETRVYRPAYLAYAALAYAGWGTRAWAWHLANVVLHAGAACLAVVALRGLFGLPPGTALLAGVVWAVHPTHVQAVTYVAAAGYLLMGLFLLLAVLIACGWWPARWPCSLRALCAVAAFAIWRRIYLIGAALQAFTRIPFRRGMGRLDMARVRHMEDLLLHVFRERPRRFMSILGLQIFAQLLLSLEIFWILRAMNLAIPAAIPFVIEGAGKFISLAFFFVPTQVGAAEGTYAVIFRSLELAAPAGIALSLIRRLRSLLVAAAGLAALWLLQR